MPVSRKRKNVKKAFRTQVIIEADRRKNGEPNPRAGKKKFVTHRNIN